MIVYDGCAREKHARGRTELTSLQGEKIIAGKDAAGLNGNYARRLGNIPLPCPGYSCQTQRPASLSSGRAKLDAAEVVTPVTGV